MTQACILPLPQSISPVGHAHWLAWHISLGRQTVPHMAQLPRSVDVSTHTGGVPHILPVVMAVQGMHLPVTQADPLAQGVPHAPQLAWSFVVSVQIAPHICWPVGQAQAPFRQFAPGGHAVPHLPQFAGSFVK
jgi:hypothetical protein